MIIIRKLFSDNKKNEPELSKEDKINLLKSGVAAGTAGTITGATSVGFGLLARNADKIIKKHPNLKEKKALKLLSGALKDNPKAAGRSITIGTAALVPSAALAGYSAYKLRKEKKNDSTKK